MSEGITNKDVLKGKWKEMQGEVKKQWGKLTDDDLTVIDGEKDKLFGVIQTKYGYAKDRIEKEYETFLEKNKK
ncbi:MAG: CsbD family protein [Synergistaceae bacterium]|nr:CsbD family protein [Synergistaceae bacterium]